MSAKIEYQKQKICVYLSGEIDHHNAGLIRVSIDDAIMKKKPEVLVLDFEEVSFMDSSGIGLVMGRYKTMKSIAGKIIIQNLAPNAYKVMKLAGLEMLGELKQKEVV